MKSTRKQDENLIPQAHKLTVEEQSKGGKASVKARRERKTIQDTIKRMMDEEAPDKIRQAFSRNGYDVATHREAMTAAILMGAMQGNPKMVDKALELIGEDYRMRAREAELKIQQERFALEKAKAEIEAEKARVWMETLKNQQEAEMEDDGFMDALKGTAKEDWDDEDNTESTVPL